MKILEISAKLNIGGAQAVTANIAKYADESMRFTYVVFGDEVGEYEADIIAKGNEIIHIPEPPNGRLKFFGTIIGIMRSGDFDVVHCHTMYSCGAVMLAARLCGIPCRVCHSHTAKDEAKQSPGRKAYKGIMRLLMKTCANVYLACGLDAGNELYGKRWFSLHGEIIKNGIEISRYAYNKETAGAIREKYHLEDKFVIGHVGHYVAVKNQRFLIDLMPEICRHRPEAVLLMFGDGEEKEMLARHIEEKQIGEYAWLMGNVDNIHEVLSAFDVFVFPSLYEGTPLALIEAQVNGLPCCVSDRIPNDACITDLVTKLDLDCPGVWIEKILGAARNAPEAYPAVVREKYEDVRSSMDRIYDVFRNTERLTK